MTEDMKPWQKGIPMPVLKELAGVFKAHDQGLILGAFTAFKENAVAEAMDKGVLLTTPERDAAMVMGQVSQRRPLKDFAGRQFATAEPGDYYIRRLAHRGKQEGDRLLSTALPDAARVWAEAFIEHPTDTGLLQAHGFIRVATKIKASSELIGVWMRCNTEGTHVQFTPAADLPGLVRLLDGLDVAPLLEQVAGLEYADHYSSYNRGHSWSALALRGFGADPQLIEKPTEMSKKWKREHPDRLEWPCVDTPLRAKLPAAEPLIAAIPGAPERVRLMRLAPGGGELERHADITDPDAGTADGKLLRIHIPLVTNEQVLFDSWGLDGQVVQHHMRAGEAWYLDTRKPHRAVNGGDTERLHLVLDVHSNPAMRALVAPGAPDDQREVGDQMALGAA